MRSHQHCKQQREITHVLSLLLPEGPHRETNTSHFSAPFAAPTPAIITILLAAAAADVYQGMLYGRYSGGDVRWGKPNTANMTAGIIFPIRVDCYTSCSCSNFPAAAAAAAAAAAGSCCGAWQQAAAQQYVAAMPHHQQQHHHHHHHQRCSIVRNNNHIVRNNNNHNNMKHLEVLVRTWYGYV